MPYERKTEDNFDVEQYTPEGWECVTGATNRKEARQFMKEYKENQPEYSYRIRKYRTKKESK